MKPDYTHFTADELALDSFFRAWVLTDDPEAAQFWTDWLNQHPQQQATVDEATALLWAFQQRFSDDLTLEQKQQAITQLHERITQTGRVVVFRPVVWWRAAAAVLLLLGIGWWLVRPALESRSVTDNPLANSQTDTSIREKRNDTDRPQTLLLADGSTVTLEAHSYLTYPVSFSGNERAVTLVGEAFFEITKDPKRPFLVYARESVTKVLGTSFRVKATDNSSDVQVAVRTGRVLVYEKKTFDQLATRSDEQPGGVILLPNQQVTLNGQNGQMVKSSVTNSALIEVPIRPGELSFDDQPVITVLHQLERLYGVSIQFDKAALAQCRITTTFADENLRERLTDICQAIGATYEIADGQVIIHSQGCTL